MLVVWGWGGGGGWVMTTVNPPRHLGYATELLLSLLSFILIAASNGAGGHVEERLGKMLKNNKKIELPEKRVRSLFEHRWNDGTTVTSLYENV